MSPLAARGEKTPEIRHMAQSGASFLRDPITVPRRERVEQYRGQASRYKRMAEGEAPSVREVLLSLAHRCDDMADVLQRERD